MAKLHASETAMSARGRPSRPWSTAATRGEYQIEKWTGEAKLEDIEEGTSDIQRLIISRGVLRD